MQYSTPGVAGDGTAALIQAMPDLGIRFPAGENGGPSAFALPYAAGLVSKAPHGATATALAELTDGAEFFQPDSEDIDKNLASYVDDRKVRDGQLIACRTPGYGRARADYPGGRRYAVVPAPPFVDPTHARRRTTWQTASPSNRGSPTWTAS
ncbi:hypothetical protein SGPA1_30174 [Streptomyces misionensis JCM 4497]